MAKSKAKGEASAQAAGDVDALNDRVVDIAKINPSNYKRSDLVFESVLASDGDKFAVGELENGKFAAVWEGHVDVVETREELDGYDENREYKGILNSHERQLLQLGVIR